MLSELARMVRPFTVQVVNRAGGGSGGGSGVVWSAAGVVVTNAHVARGDTAEVVTSSGRHIRGRVSRRDAELDLAAIETGASDLQAAEIGDSGVVRAGQMVMAMGNPLGMVGAVAAGVIHSVGEIGIGARRRWIQADVRLAPGNSGGPLVDAEGRVIGINTLVCEGLGMAIPANEVREFMAGGAMGHAARARFGIEMVALPEGLMVLKVERGSLAERSGVRMGDLLGCTADQLRQRVSAGAAEIPALRGGRAVTLRVGSEESRAA